MAIIIRDVADEEIPRACEIEALAYKDNPLNPILFPGPFPKNSPNNRVEQVVNMRKNDSTVVFLQAFDEETGKMIAFAKWHVFTTSEAAANFSRPLSLGSGRNEEACRLFFGGMADMHKKLMRNKPHLFLHLLHTDPAFQSRGAGGMLVNWGLEKSKELGVPAYLESSIAGHRFYLKHGFKDLEIFEVDFGKFGGNLHEQPLMIWEPPQSCDSIIEVTK